MEEHQEHYEKSIAGLKQTKAPDIWQSIREELDSQEEGNKVQLDQSVQQLRDQVAPDVWSSVAENLEQQKTASKGKSWQYWSIAASVALVLLSVVYWNSLDAGSATEELAYSTEEINFFEVEIEPVSAAPDADDLLLTYIRENCTRLLVTCQDPEFKALLEAYMELDQTKDQLNEQLQQAENAPRMMKYLIKVEKDQAEIGRDMLKKLKSI